MTEIRKGELDAWARQRLGLKAVAAAEIVAPVRKLLLEMPFIVLPSLAMTQRFGKLSDWRLKLDAGVGV